MEIALLEILAQDQPGGLQQMLVTFGPLILILLVFYFLIFNAKRKQDKQRQQMLSELKKNDRIQTIGGILGTVVSADDKEVLVKVDETSNTKLRFTRSAIHRVISDETNEKK